MKKTISAILIFLLIFYMLTKPAEAVTAAGNGLVLWYQTILPTLLPFAVLSNLFISSNMFYMLSRFLYPIVRLFLPVSREGTFPVFAGFLFGFPMGSRISAVMLSENKLSYEEASVIFAVTNNMSPVFISSFILHHALKLPQLVIPTFIALYLPAILLGRLLFYRQKKAQNAPHKNTAPGFQVNFKIMDAAIMNGFETLTKLGGYIMLFSIIASLMNHLPLTTIGMKAFAVGLTEITNGIQFTALTPLPIRQKYLLCVAFTAFGGISGLAQTSSMVAESRLPMKNYVIIKSVLCVISVILARLLYPIFLVG